MMRWMNLLALLLLVPCSITLFGCGGNGKPPGIFGRVVSKGTRQPIASATVTLLRGDTQVAQVTTDSEGKFAFPNLTVGDYTVVVTADGFLESRIRVTLTTEKRRESLTVELLSPEEGPPTDVPITD